MDTDWPELSWQRDGESWATLQLWTQIVGKLRVAIEPWANHSWHVPLYVDARGLTTSLIGHAPMPFDCAFDFIDETLVLRRSDGRDAEIPLQPGSVADFHARFEAMLADQSIEVAIDGRPNEIPGAVAFNEDHELRTFDPDAARRLWRALLAIDRVFRHFRSGFIGKVSPVHFFWGSFDLAVTRFSGRRAPEHPGGVPNLPDAVAREAYSHEVSSAGFWPGGPDLPEPVFYCYAWPEPDGFREAGSLPQGARYHAGLGEFVLPYAAVRNARDPEAELLAFLTATYAAAADAAGWDRAALECDLGEPGRVRDYG